MMTPALTRSWRLSGAITFTFIALALLLMLHSHWGAFLQWCLSTQITLHRYLVMYLLQLNNHQLSGGLWLLVGAFFYGVLHAIGPGHGKFIVATWLGTNHESPLASRLIPFVGSLLQGVSAIAFVFILAVGFNLAAGDLSESRWYVEKISALLIAGFGGYVIYQAARNLSVSRVPRHAGHTADCGCGHHHGVGAASAADWKTRAGVILSIGARPCSGAIMILLFSNALGMVSWGMAAVMTMSLGTGLSIMGLSLAVRVARNRTAALFGGERQTWIVPVLKIAGGITILLFAIVLFLTVIPVSANGDFIAAGC
jgi:ABC-type nickel/cobalt efflux system permease component RcnA